MYFSGQGKVYAAEVSAGVPGPFKYLGNVPALSFALEVDKLEHKESSSGQRLTDLSLIREKKASMTATLEDFNADNLARVLWGTKSTVTGGTITNEVLPTGLVAGDFVRLQHLDISAVTVRDSAGSPATLVAGEDYRVSSAKHGMIEILDPTGFTQPFKVDYTSAAVTNVTVLTESQKTYWLRFEGLNTADSNAPVLVEFYKVQLDPAREFSLIGDEVAQFEMNGTPLYDETKVGNAVLGQFGRVVHI